MTNKFANVPADADTRILFQQEARIGEYRVLYQKWSWDGISAESIVFANEGIAGLADEAIKQAVRSLPPLQARLEYHLKTLRFGIYFCELQFRAGLT